MTEKSTPSTKNDHIVRRVVQSIQRDRVPPSDDRGRMKIVMNSLVLHIHPAKVSSASLKFTYTFGLGGLLLLLGSILAVTGIMLIFVYTPSPDHRFVWRWPS